MAQPPNPPPDRQLDEIMQMDMRGETLAAGRRLVRLADQGSAEASSLLGAWLLLGKAWTADVGAGLERLECGARAGDTAAHAVLAALHACGLFAPLDRRRALQHLVTAASQGSHRASAQLALLVPADATELRARLLFDAATRGDPAGQYLLAAELQAQGSAAARDSARQWHAIAAAGGHPLARRHAQPIQGNVTLPPTPALPEPFWEAVFAAIDPAALVPASRTLHGRWMTDDPILGSVDDFMPRAWCEYLIGSGADGLTRAEVNEAGSGRPTAHHMRSNRHAALHLGRLDLLLATVWRAMLDALDVPVRQSEWPNLLHYRAGEQYAEHVDYIDPAVPAFAPELASRGQRIATALLYLDVPGAGGATDFPALGYSHAGRPGQLLAFRNVRADASPEPRSLHAGRPPAPGEEKWVLSVWMRDRNQHA